jgi:riboflavin kinase
MGETRLFSSSSGAVEYFKEALLVQGPVTAGYGRGSKKLGVPTANLPHFDEHIRASSLVNGVYFGWGCLPGEGTVLGCVANIGKSPTFVNQVYT